MRLTRWKLMAGVLGLSMCGLAALAEPACRTVGITRRAEEPKSEPTEAAKPLLPPADTAVPPPVIPAVEDKKPATLPPPIPLEIKPVDTKPVALPPVNDPKTPPAVDPKLLEEVAKAQNPPVPLPTLPEKKDAGPAPIPVPAPTLPLPGNPNPLPAPTPAPQPSPVPPPITTPPAPPAPVFPDPVVPVKNESAALSSVTGKKLKVTLHLSDDKPWFEVKDGDDLVLKVTAEGVNLSAAADAKKAAAGTLTAVGGVTFRTLGGFGTCDELQVVPGTGEVVVTGKVSVTSNWGKSETTATADKMTFRLGGDAKK